MVRWRDHWPATWYEILSYTCFLYSYLNSVLNIFKVYKSKASRFMWVSVHHQLTMYKLSELAEIILQIKEHTRHEGHETLRLWYIKSWCIIIIQSIAITLWGYISASWREKTPIANTAPRLCICSCVENVIIHALVLVQENTPEEKIANLYGNNFVCFWHKYIIYGFWCH